MTKFYRIKKSIDRIFIIKIPLVLFALMSIFGFSNLNNDKIDVISPDIKLLSPKMYTEVLPGSKFFVRADLKDNQKLDSYKIRIEKGGSSDEEYEKAFSVYYNQDASGNQLPKINGEQFVQFEFDVEVKSNAIVGDYIFSLAVKDKAGNHHEIKRYFNVCRPRL
ncbi:DUF4625 domain-containing protein [Ancylomarina salipaludis]|uniref:DUF4625 domain-containing protein n=1 Tax=Ancylomarina salipaludis TaxID=2501299 RepID=A0A4Q1JJW0_9BACT|nr:DUF4625 domain-containing protein [Ancylomarina salipaludis]RXQ92193.1 DUF4625 domain-containing protein [Ancylomarina salipaludis]